MARGLALIMGADPRRRKPAGGGPYDDEDDDEDEKGLEEEACANLADAIGVSRADYDTFKRALTAWHDAMHMADKNKSK